MFVLFNNQLSWAAELNFSWLPINTSDGTVGYKLHYGTSSRVYTNSVDVGSPVPVDGFVSAAISQLAPDQPYFFTVTAYNAQGDESSYANEVVCTVPSDAVNSKPYDIYLSKSSNLSGAVALEGAAVDGDIYVFSGPDAGVSRVTFSVDGVAAQTEYLTPFELAGGSAFDTSQLSPGQHKLTANFQLNDGSTKLVSRLFTTPSSVPRSVNTSSYDIYVTTSSNPSGAVALDGATIDGDVYVFTGPDTGVSKVIFSVDGVVAGTEEEAPFELAKGAAFDTSQLSSGKHEITANIQLSDGSTKLVSSIFNISSTGDNSANESLHDIYVSKSQNLSGAIALDGATVDGDIYVFTGPDTGVSKVIFSVDGVVARTEGFAPFELAEGAAFDASKLSPGQHEITANIQSSNGSTEMVSARFTTPDTEDSI